MGNQAENLLIILNAGKSICDSVPPGLIAVQEKRSVLDWLISGYKDIFGERIDIHIINGFRYESVEQKYPNIRMVNNPDWEATGAFYSFKLALRNLCFENKHSYKAFVTYSDVLYRPSALANK